MYNTEILFLLVVLFGVFCWLGWWIGGAVASAIAALFRPRTLESLAVADELERRRTS